MQYQAERQKYFDLVIERFSDGKGQSVDHTGMCLYENRTGNHCAIGYLMVKANIPITEYADGDVTDLVYSYNKNRMPLPNWISDNVEFFLRLQAIHDSRLAWNDTEFVGWQFMKTLAESYNLNTDKIPG